MARPAREESCRPRCRPQTADGHPDSSPSLLRRRRGRRRPCHPQRTSLRARGGGARLQAPRAVLLYTLCHGGPSPGARAMAPSPLGVGGRETEESEQGAPARPGLSPLGLLKHLWHTKKITLVGRKTSLSQLGAIGSVLRGAD